MNDSEDKQAKTPSAESWQQIQDNLKAALDSWGTLSRSPKEPTHQDKQLKDIKRLLAEIDQQIKTFEDGDGPERSVSGS